MYKYKIWHDLWLWNGMSFVTSDGLHGKQKPRWPQTFTSRHEETGHTLYQTQNTFSTFMNMWAVWSFPRAQTTLGTGLEGAGSRQLQTNKKTRGGRETRNRAARVNPSSADLSSTWAYSAGTPPFISDTLCYHSGGCGAFERLLSDGKRRREEALAGLQCWEGGRRAEMCHDVAKLPPLFTGR